MPFMEPEYFHGHFVKFQNTKTGDEFLVPEMYYYQDDDMHYIETIFGFGVRLSAPGYLDCTEWEVYSTEEEAIQQANILIGDE